MFYLIDSNKIFVVYISLDNMKLIPGYFIGAMLLTMLVLYIMYPEPNVIIKHPSPEEKVSDVYVDDNNVCYRYHRKEVTDSEVDRM